MATAITLPPGPGRERRVGQLLGFLAFRRDPLKFLTRIAREHGDVVHFRMGPQAVYLLNHPDLVRDALVTNQDHFQRAAPSNARSGCSAKGCSPARASTTAASAASRSPAFTANASRLTARR